MYSTVQIGPTGNAIMGCNRVFFPSHNRNVTVMLATLIFAGIAAALMPGISIAQDAKNQGFLLDSNGNIVRSATTGDCVRTSDWTSARDLACNPVMQPPKPVAATPPPPKRAPEPAPAPARILPQSINFAADALFDFNKAVLRPAGRAALDDFARQFRGVQYEAIFVTGHTDRLGTAKYNRKLSERRAHAVRNYLVRMGVPPDRVNASGRGETQPVTQPGDCKGPRSARLIACLQPDRRVHVEVTGTRAVTRNSR